MIIRVETRGELWEWEEKQENHDENERRIKRSIMRMRGETREVGWECEEKQEE